MSLLIGLRKADDEQKVIMINEQPATENAEVTLSTVSILLSSSSVQAIVVFFVEQTERNGP